MPTLETSLVNPGGVFDGSLRWRLRDLGDQVVLEPPTIAALLIPDVLVCVLLFAFGAVLRPNVPGSDGFFRVWFVLVPIFCVVSCTIKVFARRLGPSLILDRERQTVTYPRRQRTWLRTEVLGLQIAEHTFGDDSTYGPHVELILVVRSGADGFERYVIFPGTGRTMAEQMLELAGEIGVKMSLPIVSHARDGREAGKD